ncbi:TPA: sensor histidine kinase [Candidatus Berkelbacteria bacterium]|uniref:histidine kinase n=1 Tax=Berkelbacteria bacterium GW2011_GWE1_39_12 TaxID=1618337 RepID=A0A0G4B4K7_9BACT|nr:MAG: two-component sensor histidine kinase [Berkelbacteria bacterium GW2011_GWE1_39_12]HBO60924.1 sensor histidine kinase [Candidatus Berkelbacteria bacterium]
MDQRNEQLKELLESEKQEFLAVMSHELRTPMTGVKGYLSMVLDGDAGPISDDVKEYVSEAYVANDRLIRLVDHMMKVVAIQEGNLRFDIKKVDLVQTVEMLTHDFAEPAKEKNLTIVYEKPDHQIFVSADPDRLRELLMNLISNAIKFTQEGSITISHRNINHHLEVVDIKDTGIGIDRQQQSRIFEIFSKANLSLSGQEKGTGLGLFLANKFAEAQDGKIWLDSSEVGVGSTFSAAFEKVD